MTLTANELREHQVAETGQTRSRFGSTYAPPRRPLWKLALSAFLMLALCVVALEAVFYAAGIGEQEFLKRDPEAGYVPMPNKRITWRKEGFARIQYNSQGMPDLERPLAKPADTIRIAMIGDSYVQSLEVERDQNFLAKLEQSLAQQFPGKKFEVLNFGVSSYNLGQMLLRLKSKALQFDPDIVILLARVDTTFQLVPDSSAGFLYARPSFFLKADGSVYPDYTVQTLWEKSPSGKRVRSTEWLREHSRIWGVISKGAEQLFGWLEQVKRGTARWGADVSVKQTAFESSKSALPSSNASPSSQQSPQLSDLDAEGKRLMTFTPPSPAEDGCTRSFWPIADAIIKQMNDECTKHGAQFAIVRLVGANGRRNPLETQCIETTAKKLAVPYFDTTPEFDRAIKNGARGLYFDTHFTAYGHDLLSSITHPFAAKLVQKRLGSTTNVNGR